MPRLNVAGRSIHYLERGADRGAPIVMVHSGGLSSRQWSRLIPRLPATHRVLAPDLLGAGASDPVDHHHNFHFHEDVDVVDALLATLDEPAHLVGHSYGGLVAMSAARRHPERVRSMSLFEPVAFGVLYSRGDEPAIRDLEDYDHDGSFLDDRAGGSEPWMERFIDWWQGQGAWRRLPDPSRAAFLAVGRKVFQEVRSLIADRTPHEVYRALEIPSLLMRGERSPLAARSVCAILAESLPRARLVTVEGAGHMAPLTHGQEVGAHIAAHLAEAGPSYTGSRSARSEV
ncbi:MAG: alpha/beta hydrolase [Sandaracinaceae bacterium]|nr:alpha/beta hydrolase [Sandaracinaceae bacterium]